MMKKILLFISILATVMVANTQTLLFEDNFDSYTTGMGVAAQSADWDTWDGSPNLDGAVSTDYASSGTKSAKIEGTATDLVLPIGPYVAGKYDVKWKMLIPNGFGAYFNALHVWSSSSTTYEWAVDVFFSDQGEVTWTAEFVTGGAANIDNGEWFDVQLTADLDADVGVLYINDVIVHTWQWSINNANGNAGTNQLSAIDFYGTDDTAQGEGLYYIDDVEVWESTSVSVAPVTVFGFEINPNPANEQITVSGIDEFAGGTMQVMDLTGKIVMEIKITQGMSKSIDISTLHPGVYMVKMIGNTNEFTKKLVLR